MKMIGKSISSILIALVMIICLISGTFAADNSIAKGVAKEPDFTKNELIAIEENNEIIDNYIAGKLADLQRARWDYVSVDLPVIPVKQWTNDTCGPASGLMVANYFGVSYTQKEMEDIVGYVEKKGTSSEGWKNGFNNTVLPAAGESKRYERVNMSSANLWNSIIYSADNEFPLVPTVKQMPLYTSDGHFIVVKGYYMDIFGTQVVNYCDPHYNDNYFGSHSMTRQQMETACSSNGGYFVRLDPNS